MHGSQITSSGGAFLKMRGDQHDEVAFEAPRNGLLRSDFVLRPFCPSEKHCLATLDLKVFNCLLGQRSDDPVNIAGRR
jgi:hypothetical protein